MKIVTFRVRQVEEAIFDKVNSKFGHELKYYPHGLDSSNVELVKGYECLIVRANDNLDASLLQTIWDYGVRYLLTRTVATNHIDLEAAHKIGFKMARVPSYSPTAIAELAFSLAHSLSRKTLHFAEKGRNKDYTVDAFGFAKELKNSTVGIISVGKIGLACAKMFKAFAKEVIAYDPYQSEQAKEVVTFVELDELLKRSDVISVHTPYMPGVNDKMINDEFISKMKTGAILVNSARGQIQDEKALLKALKTNKLAAIATDVLNEEGKYFFKKLDKYEDKTIEELMDFYPRFVLTPHVGSYTDEAALNMIEISYENLEEYLKTNDCKNKI
ncbi:NAD(P)-dependent oxidoreductase [Mycoplasmopsis alligatoris]|uniref:Putative D-lactate dehydrogenase n=1 Tax=Mycoplasmopsis alligatoris A21JP2 TaxID=747682 RepID=D4XVE7_9BACT|nr:NAD(P)-dependent oxidoreductase [Mycoplasmopsis alligatoris]EFF41629.1 putative D-lactate dehydrogenase [Mycoplasmopsis alligatoris A21JP2]